MKYSINFDLGVANVYNYVILTTNTTIKLGFHKLWGGDCPSRGSSLRVWIRVLWKGKKEKKKAKREIKFISLGCQ